MGFGFWDAGSEPPPTSFEARPGKRRKFPGGVLGANLQAAKSFDVFEHYCKLVFQQVSLLFSCYIFVSPRWNSRFLRDWSCHVRVVTICIGLNWCICMPSMGCIACGWCGLTNSWRSVGCVQVQCRTTDKVFQLWRIHAQGRFQRQNHRRVLSAWRRRRVSRPL